LGSSLICSTIFMTTEQVTNFDPTPLNPTGSRVSETNGRLEVPTYDFEGAPRDARLGVARSAIWYAHLLTRDQFVGLGHCVDGLLDEVDGTGPVELREELTAMRTMLGTVWANRVRDSRTFKPMLMERID